MARNLEFANQVNLLIGQELYNLRTIKGYTRAQLAKKIEVSYQQILKYEQGIDHITIGRLYLALTELEADFTEVMTNIFNTVQPLATFVPISLNKTSYQTLKTCIAKDLQKITNERRLKAISTIVQCMLDGKDLQK